MENHVLLVVNEHHTWKRDAHVHAHREQVQSAQEAEQSDHQEAHASPERVDCRRPWLHHHCAAANAVAQLVELSVLVRVLGVHLRSAGLALHFEHFVEKTQIESSWFETNRIENIIIIGSTTGCNSQALSSLA